ncbi:hypothetical protein [Clostridium minihomine]|uniref:hypothetical protein n=1 Tax=Clostridium minihomine TaxID=2045012 RepID=UPI0013EC4F91|nr:hypothetical protein [Clostridium minihomine]
MLFYPAAGLVEKQQKKKIKQLLDVAQVRMACRRGQDLSFILVYRKRSPLLYHMNSYFLEMKRHRYNNDADEFFAIYFIS